MRGPFQSGAPHAVLIALLAVAPAAAQTPPPVPLPIIQGRDRPYTPRTSPPPATIINPAWVVRPEPVFPAAASDSNIREGRVTYRCNLQRTGAFFGCVTVQETPTGYGFDEAARRSLGNARIAAQTSDGGSVQFTIRMVEEPPPPVAPPRPVSIPVLPPSPPPPPRSGPIIPSPRWLIPPRAEYPDRALGSDESGRAILRCNVSPQGWLSDCGVVEEFPVRLGFGPASVVAANGARVSPLVIDGVAQTSQVQFVITFRLPTD